MTSFIDQCSSGANDPLVVLGAPVASAAVVGSGSVVCVVLDFDAVGAVGVVVEHDLAGSVSV